MSVDGVGAFDLVSSEQGDDLMPLLFCLAQHPALVAANERLEAEEHLFAYLDDLYTSCEDPDHSALGEELERHAHISIHHGKTKVWNSGGLEPAGCQHSRGLHLRWEEAVVWRGDATLPPEQQGIRVLGLWGTPTSSAISSGRNLMLTVACSNAFLQLVTCRPLAVAVLCRCEAQFPPAHCVPCFHFSVCRAA